MRSSRSASRFAFGALSLALTAALSIAVAAGCSSDPLPGNADDSNAGDDSGFAPICPDGSCATQTGVVTPVGDGTSLTQSIGPGGGIVMFEGYSLAIPAGALTSDVAITVTASPESAPAGVTNLSPVYTTTPVGTVFATPALLSITFEVGGDDPLLVVATNANTSGYVAEPTSIVATTSTATASIGKLADAFVANGTTLGTIPIADGGTAVVTSDAGIVDGGND